MIIYGNETIDITRRVFERLYPQAHCEIFFAHGYEGESFPHGPKGRKGFTLFPADGSMPVIVVNASLPYDLSNDILVHELAHVAAPARKSDTDGHTRAWERAYKRITREVHREMGLPAPEFFPNLRQRMKKETTA